MVAGSRRVPCVRNRRSGRGWSGRGKVERPSSGRAAAEQAPEAKAPPKPREIPEAERARIEKQLADAGEKLTSLQEEELELSIKVLKAESNALDHVEDRNKLKDALTKGPTSQDLVDYRNVMLACAQQWQLVESKYVAVHRSLRYLEQKRGEMPEDLKSSVEEVVARILKNRRSCMEKAAAVYDKLMDDKMVLAVYVAIYQMLPDDQREADTALKEKILALKNKLESPEKKKDAIKKNDGNKKWR